MEIEIKEQTMSKWSGEGCNWFVLFVRTGHENEVAERLRAILDTEKFHAFVPTRAYNHKKDSKREIFKRIWLRSYVFIATTESAKICTKMVEPLIFNDSTIFRFVSYAGSIDTIFLSKDDMDLFRVLLDDNFHLPAIKTKLVDGKHKAIENQFNDYRVKFGKYNPNKQSIALQVEVLGESFNTEVAYDATKDFDSSMT